MKKFLIGCGIVLLLCIVGVCGIVGYIGYQGYKAGKGIQEAVVQVSNQIEQSNQDYPFTKPDPISIDPQRFAAMMELRQAVTENIQQDPLLKKFLIASDPDTASEQQPDISAKDTLSFMTKMGGKIQENSDRFFEELNDREMSFEEYRYLNMAALALLQLEASKAEGNRQIEEFTQDVREYSQQYDISIDLQDYAQQWKEVDEETYNETLQMLSEYENSWEYVEESLILDFLLMTIQQGDFGELQNVMQPAGP